MINLKTFEEYNFKNLNPFNKKNKKNDENEILKNEILNYNWRRAAFQPAASDYKYTSLKDGIILRINNLREELPNVYKNYPQLFKKSDSSIRITFEIKGKEYNNFYIPQSFSFILNDGNRIAETKEEKENIYKRLLNRKYDLP